MGNFYRTPLISLADYINGYAFKPEDFTDSGLPVIRIEQLKSKEAQLDLFDGVVPAKNLIVDGDLIFSWSASLFLQIWNRDDAILNQHLFKVIPRPNVDKTFLKYCIEHSLPELIKSAHGSTMQHITRRELAKFEVDVPESKAEQQQIASVLARVDRAIEQTQVLVAKHERVKTGLMQDLFSRGLDESGQLRDPATHAFKDSPLGRIPAEWESITLGEVLERSGGFVQTGLFGSQLHAHEYVNDGVPVVMPQDITQSGGINWRTTARITEERARQLSRHKLKQDSIIFGRRGDLSRCAVLTQDYGLCGTGCLLARFSSKDIYAPWLSHYYRSDKAQRQVANEAVGSTMVNLNTMLIKGLLTAKPSANEQRRILQVLAGFDRLASHQRAHLAKLHRLKAGLMQDLLSGNVSVAPLLEKNQPTFSRTS